MTAWEEYQARAEAETAAVARSWRYGRLGSIPLWVAAALIVWVVWPR